MKKMSLILVFAVFLEGIWRMVGQVVPGKIPPPEYKTLLVPEGMVIPVRVTKAVSSATAKVGDAVAGTVAADLVAGGFRIFAKGGGGEGAGGGGASGAEDGSGRLARAMESVQRRDEAVSVEAGPYKVEGMNTASVAAGRW